MAISVYGIFYAHMTKKVYVSVYDDNGFKEFCWLSKREAKEKFNLTWKQVRKMFEEVKFIDENKEWIIDQNVRGYCPDKVL